MRRSNSCKLAKFWGVSDERRYADEVRCFIHWFDISGDDLDEVRLAHVDKVTIQMYDAEVVARSGQVMDGRGVLEFGRMALLAEYGGDGPEVGANAVSSDRLNPPTTIES